jgi:hypothetical protein
VKVPNRSSPHNHTMQYVGRAIGTVSKTWNSINPATLSGAIDIIVVEREDGEYGHQEAVGEVELMQ